MLKLTNRWAVLALMVGRATKGERKSVPGSRGIRLSALPASEPRTAVLNPAEGTASQSFARRLLLCLNKRRPRCGVA